MLEQPVKNRNQEENLGESKISTRVGIELYRCSVLVLVPLVLVLKGSRHPSEAPVPVPVDQRNLSQAELRARRRATHRRHVEF